MKQGLNKTQTKIDTLFIRNKMKMNIYLAIFFHIVYCMNIWKQNLCSDFSNVKRHFAELILNHAILFSAYPLLCVIWHTV